MKLLEHARHSRFLRHNSIFLIGAVAVGALNYIYYPIMGRLLDTVSFGEVQTLISLFLQATIFLSVIGLVTINIVTNYRSKSQRNAVVLEFEKLALGISFILLLAAIVCGSHIARFLHFDDTLPFVLLAFALIASVPFTLRGAFLRGKQQFGRASLTNLASAAGKMLFAVLLVGIGLGTGGAIGGLVAAQIVACGLSAWWAAKAGLRRPAEHRRTILPNFTMLAPELRYGALVLIGSLIITAQYSLDVIVVKHYFDPHTAGLYAGVASVARIIFFITASVGLVLMSLVRLDAEPAKNRKVLLQSLALTSCIGLPIVALAVLAPTWLTGVLMGASYQSVAQLLPRLSTAIFIISLLNVVASYYLALRRFAVAPPLVLGAIVTYGLMYSHHASLGAVVDNLLTGSIAMLAVLGIWMGSGRIKELLWQRN